MVNRFGWKALMFLVIAVALAVGLVLTGPAKADDLYGSIRGTVTDPTGALVPDANLTATNVATGVVYTATSDKSGSFTFLQLPVGSYAVKAEARGFKTFATTAIHLDVSQIYVLEVKMEVGAVTMEVEVQANAVQVESTSMQLGDTITGDQIVDMPLNGRNWTQLQQLEPGVMSSSDRFGTYSTNGAETQQNSFLINGADSNDLPLNTVGLIPSPDAIGEFRLITSTINPEYGRNSGAIVNAVIKNGTNQFHGDGFEFYRDTFMDAKNFFEQSASPFHQNQFGGVLGGPIKKDKAFFFGSYQGTRSFSPQGFNVPTVFSPAERTGDFSVDTGGGAFPKNNSSPFPLVGSSGATFPAGTPYATLFPTGVIPTADLNALSLKLMNQFVPLPNLPGNLFTFNPVNPFLQDQAIYRVDFNLTPKDSLWVYGFWERHPDTETLPFTGATLPGFEETDGEHFQEYTAAWNHTFSTNTLNEVRFSYFRFNFDAVQPTDPINPTTFGFTGITPQTQSGASLPVVSLTGLFTLGFSANGPQPRIDQTYQAVDNFTHVIGHHTLKFGFTMERFQVFNPFSNNLSGNYSFGQAGAFSTGNAGADFLLGIPDSYDQGSGSIINARAQEYYSYGQDEWRIRKNLTLTLGMGWDIETPYRNLTDNGETQMTFRLGQQSTVFPTAPVGFVYPGDAGVSKYGGPTTNFHNFAPRLGFAWSPDFGGPLGWLAGGPGKTSIRGGFGLYYNRTEEELALQGLTNPPFSTTTSGVTSLGGTPNFGNPFTGVCNAGPAPVACTTPQVFPFTAPAPGTPVNFAPFEPIGFGVGALLPNNFGTPRSSNYNLTIERQLNSSTILSIGYVGLIGRHLEGAFDLNQAGSAPGVNPVAAADGCNAFNLATCAPGTFQLSPSVYGQPGTQVTDFNSHYNALQIELNKRFSHGLQILASYTWSRNFDDTSSLENSAFNAPGINPFNPGANYGPSANDAPQRLVISYVYTLPIYHFVQKWRALTDDWNVTGITTFQHGFPVNVFDSADTSLICDPAITFYACPDRANVVPGQPLGITNPRDNAGNFYLNPAKFAIPALGAGIGDANRNPFYGPGINNWDMAILKNIHVTESMYFQLRWETFNTFNHTQFASPVNDVNNPLFGRIFGVQNGSTQGEGRVMQLGGKFYF